MCSACSALRPAASRLAFREAELPPLAWYDLPWELDRAGAEGLPAVV